MVIFGAMVGDPTVFDGSLPRVICYSQSGSVFDETGGGSYVIQNGIYDHRLYGFPNKCGIVHSGSVLRGILPE